jgi:regulator of protease activity HflC (stomatin/prohibitin superfamily)
VESLILFILAILLILASIKTVKDDERLVVFRLGRFFKILGPGVVLIIPIVDKGVRVNLSEKIPGWQALSKEELNEKLKSLVLEESRVSPG